MAHKPKYYRQRQKNQPLPKPGKTARKATIEETRQKQRELAVKIFTVVYLLILFFSYVKTYQYIFDEKLDLGGDNANYFILGKALAEGHGYKSISMYNAPPHNHFPPGYPAIIAFVMKFFSDEITTIKTANGIMFFFTLIILFFVFRKLTQNIHLSFVLCIITLLNSIMLKHSTIMMSEIPYMLFTSLNILLFINLDFTIHPLKNRYFYPFLLTLSFVYYIRSLGIALLGGILLYLLIKKNWKYLIATISGFALLALPWFIRGKIIGGGSYMSQLFMKNPYRPEMGNMEMFDWFTRFGKNLMRYITREIPSGTFPFIHVDYDADITVMQWIIGIIILLIAAYGLYKLPKQRILILWYLLGTFGIVLLWPDVWFGPRYIIPVIPFILLLTVYGIYGGVLMVAERKYKLNNRLISNILIPWLFLFSIPLFLPGVKELHAFAEGVYSNTYRNFFEIAKWSRYNTPADAIFCCRKPALFYAYAQRPMTLYKYTTDKEELIDDLKEKNVRFVVLEQLGYASTGRYLVPAIQRYPLKFNIIQHLQDPDTYLLEFNYELDYIGEWKDEKKNGHGKFTWEDGRIYEGDWKDDMMTGYGTFTWPDGSRYEGQWFDNLRHGKGTFYSADGRKMETEWRFDKPLYSPGD